MNEQQRAKSRANYAKWYEANKEKAREYKKARMKEYRTADPGKYNKQSREAKARIRAKIFAIYGYECVGCGFHDLRALTLDHILANGAKERRELGERGVYLRAVNKYRPDEYRILCMNCQFIARHNHDWANRPDTILAARAWQELSAFGFVYLDDRRAA